MKFSYSLILIRIGTICTNGTKSGQSLAQWHNHLWSIQKHCSFCPQLHEQPQHYLIHLDAHNQQNYAQQTLGMADSIRLITDTRKLLQLLTPTKVPKGESLFLREAQRQTRESVDLRYTKTKLINKLHHA